MHKIDAPHATPDNEFTDGNPSTGIEATELIAKFFNTVQRELVAVVESAGLTLNDLDDDQLLEAITTILASHGNLTSPHGATAAATPDRLVLRDSNGRASFGAGVFNTSNAAIMSQFQLSSSENGYMTFPNGFTIQWGVCAGSEDVWAARDYPIPFTAAFGIVGSGNTSSFDLDQDARLDLLSATQFRVATNGSIATVRWMAVGVIV